MTFALSSGMASNRYPLWLNRHQSRIGRLVFALCAFLGILSTVPASALVVPAETEIAEKPISDIEAEIYAPKTGEIRVWTITSNNKGRKERYSLLHESRSTWQPFGERRYMMVDSSFQMIAEGDQLRIIGQPRLKLNGINSALGRWGEIILLEGGTLTIGRPSSGFRGEWDRDGLAGAGTVRVRPTRILTGRLPFHLRTYGKDNKILTDETGTFVFKDGIMGASNGIYQEDNLFSFWLWGMSEGKISSPEFSYLGVDLAVTTWQTIKPTGIPGPVALLAPDTLKFPREGAPRSFRRRPPCCFFTSSGVTSSGGGSSGSSSGGSGSSTGGSSGSSSGGSTTGGSSTGGSSTSSGSTSGGSTSSSSTSGSSTGSSGGSTSTSSSSGSSTSSSGGSSTSSSSGSGTSTGVVPEPAPLSLFFLGGIALVLLRRRAQN